MRVEVIEQLVVAVLLFLYRFVVSRNTLVGELLRGSVLCTHGQARLESVNQPSAKYSLADHLHLLARPRVEEGEDDPPDEPGRFVGGMIGLGLLPGRVF